MNDRHSGWAEVAQECPRRIMGVLHRQGLYVHGICPARPGRVLCLHRDTPLPEGWQLTPAQQAASSAQLLTSVTTVTPPSTAQTVT